MGAGKRAAESIHRYLNGMDLRANRFEDAIKPVPEELLPDTDHVEKQARSECEELPVARGRATSKKLSWP